MKKTALAALGAAVVAGLGFSGVATAEVILGTGTPKVATDMTTTDAVSFRINEVERTGHQLIIPYYTIQNGQSTAFNIVNTDRVNGKAVKIRFRGAVNSDDVLDFQIFLSPGDVFGAWLEPHPDGRLRIATVDNSCTLPRFSTVPGSGAQDKVDGGIGYIVSKIDRVGGPDLQAATREGYIEIINMADIVRRADGSTTATPTSPAWTAIKHSGGKNPAPSCAGLNVIAGRANLDTEANAAAQGFDTPSTGLTADWYLLNLNQTTSFSGAATALEAVSDTNTPARGRFVVFAQSNILHPDVDIVTTATSDPLLRNSDTGMNKAVDGTVTSSGGLVLPSPVIRAQHYDLPDMSTPYFTDAALGVTTPPDAKAPRQQAAILSQTLAKTSVSNQYVVTGADFDTDWVFSLPSRRYSVAINYDALMSLTPLYRVFTAGIMGDGKADHTTAGNGAFFRDDNAMINRRIDPDLPRICVNTDDIVYWDREENESRDIVVESPGEPGTLGFCGETTIMRIGSLPVLGSVISTQAVLPPVSPFTFTEGWAWIGTANSTTTTTTTGGATVTAANRIGLPIIGYGAIRARNNSVTPPTNFGYTWQHRYNLPTR